MRWASRKKILDIKNTRVASTPPPAAVSTSTTAPRRNTASTAAVAPARSIPHPDTTVRRNRTRHRHPVNTSPLHPRQASITAAAAQAPRNVITAEATGEHHIRSTNARGLVKISSWLEKLKRLWKCIAWKMWLFITKKSGCSSGLAQFDARYFVIFPPLAVCFWVVSVLIYNLNQEQILISHLLRS